MILRCYLGKKRNFIKLYANDDIRALNKTDKIKIELIEIRMCGMTRLDKIKNKYEFGLVGKVRKTKESRLR